MRTTAGHRIYAIGDVHGCDGELGVAHEWIADDLAQRPHPQPLLIHLGDYVDRGPEVPAVIDRLLALGARADLPTVCLRGNHDEYLHIALTRGWTADAPNWLQYGGVETCLGYGVEAGLDFDAEALRRNVPEAHQRFLAELPLWHRLGSYLFVHAGIRPGIAIEAQSAQDLMWIRREFLESRTDHGWVVVHGHTVTSRVVDHGNRIGIDTGAVYGGHLSCLVLEEAEVALLGADGPMPL
ncbi:MAG: metallophosphoesterase family protein [Pseudomonadota bacterium]